MSEIGRIESHASRLAAAREPCALVSILAASGSTYRRAGAMVLVESSGTMHGAVSGGCLDADLREHARQVMASGTPKVVDYRSADDDSLFGVAMGCGGELRILIEPVDEALSVTLAFAAANDSRPLVAWIQTMPRMATRITLREQFEALPAGTASWPRDLPPAREVFLFGAGPEAEPFVALARHLGWRVTVADHRAALVENRFGEATTVVAPVETLVERSAPGPDAAALVMMHNLPHDLTLLRALLQRPLAYLGVLGPRRRTGGLLHTLGAEGISTEGTRFYAPTGFDIGAETPAEIALSIAAEMQAVFTRSGGAALRDKLGPIHDRWEAELTGTPEDLPLLDVPVAILAAGASSRMGVAKQLLEVDGESLLRRASRLALAARCGEVIVVLGAGREEAAVQLEGLAVRIVENRDWASGIASSVRAAVEAADQPAARALLVTLVDQPLIGAAHLRRVAATLLACDARVAATAYPEGGGVPAAFDRELFDELRALEGDAGARELIRRLPSLTIEIPLERVADVDTVGEYERVRAGCRVGD